jgi:serine protease
MQFNAWRADEASVPAAHPVCRFFGTPGVGPNSHFYTADADECAAVRANPDWQYEGIAFRAIEPSGFATCPSGTTIIQRLWFAGTRTTASRHRYLSDPALIPPMEAAGWTLEGPVFCAPQ